MEIVRDRHGEVTVTMHELDRMLLKTELAGKVDAGHPMIGKLYHLLALLDGELT